MQGAPSSTSALTPHPASLTLPPPVPSPSPSTSRGAGAAWHLEHVEVWQAGGSHYYFWADQWLDKAAGTDVIFLYPTSGADQKQLYKVRFDVCVGGGAWKDCWG